MTRKDFELIASVVKRTRPYASATETYLLNELSVKFSNSLADTNPRFDRNKFLTACGYDPNFEG